MFFLINIEQINWRGKQDIGLGEFHGEKRQAEIAGEGVSVSRKQVLPTRIQRTNESLLPQHQVEPEAYRGLPLPV